MVMTAVENSQISNTRLLFSFENIANIKNLLTEIVSSQRIMYIHIRTYSKQHKSSGVVVISVV